MPVRIVEGKLPYTGGTAIEIDTNKVISLLLREENNLIMVNSDNELYTDLQLETGLTPSSTFPVGVTVGKILQAEGRPQSGLILNWKTTSGDYARWIYANDGKLYFDSGTGIRKQVYYASEVDALFTALRDEIDEYYMKRIDFNWITKTGNIITLELSTDYTPEADFVVNPPAEIEEGQTYILRVNNGNTAYNMTLGQGINNMQGADTSLTANATDMFVFLALQGELELQKEIPSGSLAPNNGVLTIQQNGTTVQTFGANQSTNVTANIVVPAAVTVVDDVTSQSTTSALSANQGYILKGLIDDLAGFGKFLSLWNATTGQPISFPLSTPYTYSTGDYFVVETVSSATPPVNYKPNGSSYTGTASSTTESDELEVGDVYVYDGSVWLLQSNHGKTVTFANIAGQPTDNTNLAKALGNIVYINGSAPATPYEGQLWYDSTNDLLKVYDGSNRSTLGTGSGDVTGPASSTDGNIALFNGATGKIIKDSSVAITDLNTKTFYLTGTTGATNIATAQAALDWYNAGKNPIIIYSNNAYQVYSKNTTTMVLYDGSMSFTDGNSYTTITSPKKLTITYASNVVSTITATAATSYYFLRTSKNYTTPYTPQYNGSPATKKYVDDQIAAIPASGIQNDTTGTTTTITKIRAGSEAEYALITPDAHTIYHVYPN